jgi:hypothetical protein
MNTIISLLKEKNLFLEKFFAVNEHELINFVDGDFDNVEAFYQARDKLLLIIREIDLQIDQRQQELSNQKLTPRDEDRIRVSLALVEKDEIVERILSQDLQILSMVEREKSNIIRELQTVGQTKKAVGAYKSGAQSRQLDEKI